MTRSEHIEWCKERALKYLDIGDVTQAFGSLVSDLRMHLETENHAAIRLGMLLMMAGHLSTTEEMRNFIEGCH